MQRSTASPSAAMYSSDNDCVASQSTTINETAALTHTSNCGRPGCTVVFVYGGATDWPTVNRLIDEHYPVCTGGIRGLVLSYPPADTHSTPKTLSPPQLAPESLDSKDGHRDNFIIAGHSKRRKREGERKEDLENDEYTGDVRPTSVRCRGCDKVICLDKRSRYYPGLWVKHRGKCPGILKLENKKLARGEDWFRSSDPERAASASGASGEYWEGDEEEDEDTIMEFSTSSVHLYNNRQERGEEVMGVPALHHDEGNSGARM